MSLPRLPARNPDEHHRAATPLELLFDLISVIAIAAVTHGLSHAISAGHGLEALPRFAFLFVAIWWAWINFTWFASAFDNDGFFYRVLVVLIMAGELIFAGGAGQIFETLDFSFGILGWVLMRIGMAALWLRAAANPEYRTTCLRYGGGIVLAQTLWVGLYFTAAPGSALFMAGGLAIFLLEFAVPVFAERARITPFHRHHIMERYGLLTIITLGEIMLSISHGFGFLYAAPLNALPAFTALAALVITFALFWLYFSEEEHLPSRDFWPTFTWGYGHLAIFAAISALGAGITAEIDLSAQMHAAPAELHAPAAPAHGAPEAALPGTAHGAAPKAGHGEDQGATPEAAHGASRSALAWYLAGPLALFFATLWLVRDRHHQPRLGPRGRALPVMALVALAGGALGLPTTGFAVIALAALLWRVPMPRL